MVRSAMARSQNPPGIGTRFFRRDAVLVGNPIRLASGGESGDAHLDGRPIRNVRLPSWPGALLFRHRLLQPFCIESVQELAAQGAIKASLWGLVGLVPWLDFCGCRRPPCTACRPYLAGQKWLLLRLPCL